jgi:hypothetical protein
LWDHSRVVGGGGQRSVRDLVVPALLVRLIGAGRWKHPGVAVFARVAPWFDDPVNFLGDVEDMERQSRALDLLVDDEESARLFHLARPHGRADSVDLPWLDVEHAYFIALSQRIGDDTAVALDYRTDPADPAVVGSDIWTVPHQYHWRTISPTFSAFAEALGIDDPGRTSE